MGSKCAGVERTFEIEILGQFSVSTSREEVSTQW